MNEDDKKLEAYSGQVADQVADAGCNMQMLRERFAAHVGSIVNYADAILIRTRLISSQIAATDAIIASVDLPMRKELEENGERARRDLAAAEDLLLFEIRRMRAQINGKPDAKMNNGDVRFKLRRIGT